MTFETLSPTDWDAQRGPFDFHVRLEQDNYVIDVFDAGIADADKAYLSTHECETWKQVVRYCREYDGVSIV